MKTILYSIHICSIKIPLIVPVKRVFGHNFWREITRNNEALKVMRVFCKRHSRDEDISVTNVSCRSLPDTNVQQIVLSLTKSLKLDASQITCPSKEQLFALAELFEWERGTGRLIILNNSGEYSALLIEIPSYDTECLAVIRFYPSAAKLDNLKNVTHIMLPFAS